jgi:hypothetical protein
MEWSRLPDEARIKVQLYPNEAGVLLAACTDRTQRRVDMGNSPLFCDRLVLEAFDVNPDDPEDATRSRAVLGNDDFIDILCEALREYAASTCEVVEAISPDRASLGDCIQRCKEGTAALDLEEELHLAVLARQHDLHRRVAEILLEQDYQGDA